MQRRSLGIYNWYVILDSILASNTVDGLHINCKNSLSQVFFEVLDLSTSFFVLFCLFGFFFFFFGGGGGGGGGHIFRHTVLNTQCI